MVLVGMISMGVWVCIWNEMVINSVFSKWPIDQKQPEFAVVISISSIWLCLGDCLFSLGSIQLFF